MLGAPAILLGAPSISPKTQRKCRVGNRKKKKKKLNFVARRKRRKNLYIIRIHSKIKIRKKGEKE